MTRDVEAIEASGKEYLTEPFFLSVLLVQEKQYPRRSRQSSGRCEARQRLGSGRGLDPRGLPGQGTGRWSPGLRRTATAAGSSVSPTAGATRYYVWCPVPEGLAELAEWASHQYIVRSSEYALRRGPDVFEYVKRQVLKLNLRNADTAERLAREIEQLDSPYHFVIFNADLMPAQTYFFEKDFFPLARVRAEKAGDQIRWELLDSVMSEEYQTPPLRKASIEVRVGASGASPGSQTPSTR